MEKELSTEKPEKKKKPWLIAAAAILAVTAGAAITRYTPVGRRLAELLPAKARFSSNYLTDDEVGEYTIADWGNEGVRFQLFNYESDNVDLISGKAIQYTIEAQDCEITVTDEIGDVVEAADGVYTMPENTRRIMQNVCLMPTNGQSEVAVRVSVVNCRMPDLSAVFRLRKMEEPDYTVADQGEHVLVTIHANDYSGAVKINWSPDFSPDTSDDRMAAWEDGGAPYGFDVKEKESYELIFHKNMAETYNKPLEQGRYIMIGESSEQEDAAAEITLD